MHAGAALRQPGRRCYALGANLCCCWAPLPAQREASQDEDLAEVTALDLRSKELAELGPVDQCRNLRVLDLRFNLFTLIPG